MFIVTQLVSGRAGVGAQICLPPKPHSVLCAQGQAAGWLWWPEFARRMGEQSGRDRESSSLCPSGEDAHSLNADVRTGSHAWETLPHCNISQRMFQGGLNLRDGTKHFVKKDATVEVWQQRLTERNTDLFIAGLLRAFRAKVHRESLKLERWHFPKLSSKSRGSGSNLVVIPG